MKKRKKSDLAVLLDYAGSYRRLTFLGLGLSAVSMVLSIVPYIGQRLSGSISAADRKKCRGHHRGILRLFFQQGGSVCLHRGASRGCADGTFYGVPDLVCRAAGGRAAGPRGKVLPVLHSLDGGLYLRSSGPSESTADKGRGHQL